MHRCSLKFRLKCKGLESKSTILHIPEIIYSTVLVRTNISYDQRTEYTNVLDFLLTSLASDRRETVTMTTVGFKFYCAALKSTDIHLSIAFRITYLTLR